MQILKLEGQHFILEYELRPMESVSAQCMLFLDLGRFNVIQGQRPTGGFLFNFR